MLVPKIKFQIERGKKTLIGVFEFLKLLKIFTRNTDPARFCQDPYTAN